MDLTIIISHTQDYCYLNHSLDIFEQLGYKRKNIWIDGYQNFNLQMCGIVNKVTTHGDPHGAHSYDLLKEATTEYVLIVDSDFFCMDRGFWDEVFRLSQSYPIVSIYRPWASFSETPFIPLKILTTPFVLYRRKEVLDMVPVRAVWNHFYHIFPTLPDPVFDHLMFVFLTALKSGRAIGVDNWIQKDRKYNFCHLWDSRHTYRENFEDFDKRVHEDQVILEYLSYGVSKYLFQYVSNLIPVFEDKIWTYIGQIMQASVDKINPKPWLNILDTFSSLESVISFKTNWLERFLLIKEKFDTVYIKNRDLL